ncbi:MAG: transposase [Phormidium sp. PBR-2020]|nr:MAG: transposase [Phormidium sp. PBR-2020]
MAYRKTPLNPGEYYHIYNRGNNRQTIFFERDNYIYFLHKLRHYLIEPQHIHLIAYCLIPNHYHLLIHLNSQEFSQAMRKFSLSYTKAINKKYQRVGSLFQGPFQSCHVNSNPYLLHLSRYIHLNPVEHHVTNPADWEFSSYPDYLKQRQGTLPQSHIILQQFPTLHAYRSFVEQSTPTPSLSHLIME